MRGVFSILPIQGMLHCQMNPKDKGRILAGKGEELSDVSLLCRCRTFKVSFWEDREGIEDLQEVFIVDIRVNSMEKRS